MLFRSSRKLRLVNSLYPATQKKPELAQKVVAMFDQVMGGQQGVAEALTPDQIAKLQQVKSQIKQQQELQRSAPLSPEKQAELDQWERDFKSSHGSRTFAQDNIPSLPQEPVKPDWRTLPRQTRGKIRTQKQKMDQLLSIGEKINKMIATDILKLKATEQDQEFINVSEITKNITGAILKKKYIESFSSILAM